MILILTIVDNKIVNAKQTDELNKTQDFIDECQEICPYLKQFCSDSTFEKIASDQFFESNNCAVQLLVI
jgi:hypothetical protein